MSLLKQDLETIWHPFTQHQTAEDPLVIIRAKDTLLYTENGRTLIDANSSWWVNIHGHGHPHIQQAISRQFEELDHVVFAGATHPKAIELSRRLIKELPEHLTRVFFSDNGSTAVEVALKMVMQFWYNQGQHRPRIVALEGAYHGDTFGAMSVGQRSYFNKPFEHLFFDVDFLPFPDSDQSDQLIEVAESLFSSGEVAGFIVEPLIQGSAGMKMYPAELLDRLTACATKNKIPVIFDEVMTGFGRTGSLFAMDQCTNKPDIVCLSKGLTGGVLPLGLTITTEDLFQHFLSDDKSKALLHGHSFTGNALSCAASCASLDLLLSDTVRQKIAQIESWNKDAANTLGCDPFFKNVRVCGTIIAFEAGGEDHYFTELRDKLYRYFIDRDILIRPLGSTVFLNPPYCISKEEHERIIHAMLLLPKELKL